MKRYLCVLLMLAWVLSSAPALAAEAPSFSDVPEDYWARESIERAAREGVVQGTGGGLFSPERPLSADIGPPGFRARRPHGRSAPLPGTVRPGCR